QDFNKIWTNCICGSDGQPVANGPFYLSNYTKGQGTTLKANPFWYGKKPGLAEVDFKIIEDTNTEVQAMRGGEVDAISPTFGSNLLPRSEEHTSELQSLRHLVCRLLLEKKKKKH